MAKLTEILTLTALVVIILSGCQQLKLGTGISISSLETRNQELTVSTLQLEYTLLEKRLADLEKVIYASPDKSK